MTDQERMDAAYQRCMETMASAQRNYDASLTEAEREQAETCECLLCQGMRDMRKAIAEWEEARRCTTMLPPPCPDDGEVE